MPPIATMSNARFWLCTAGIVLVWIVVITAASPLEQRSLSTAKFWDKNQVQEQRLEKSCQTLCEQCGCMGFYCGDECLCEYDKHSSYHQGGQKRNSTKTRAPTNYECIATMQNDAHTLNLPFEILIQGPSSERFIRTAIQFELDGARAGVLPKKRATISIYRPYMATQSNTLQQSNEVVQISKPAAIRPRRSTEHLDWFSDFASALVRPAPLRKSHGRGIGSGSNKKREMTRDEDDSTLEKPVSWFSDHPKRLLRPAPLFRRQSVQKSSSEEYPESDNRDSQETTRPLVGEVIKNTIRNIQGSDIGEGLRAGFRDSSDILHNTIQDGNIERFRNDFAEVLDAWLKNQQPKDASLEVPAMLPHAASPVSLPWFHPVRFLRRVHHALK